MVCKNCGNEIKDAVAFCPYCGTPIEKEDSNSMAQEDSVPEEKSIKTYIDQPFEGEKFAEPDSNIENNTKKHIPFNSKDLPSIVKTELLNFVKNIKDNLPKVKNYIINKKKWFIGGAIALIIIITGVCWLNQPELTGISATYNGDCSNGVVLDENTKGFVVYGFYEGGKSKKVHNWTIQSPQTLKTDEAAKVEIEYKGFSDSLVVACSTKTVLSITPTYTGELSKGTTVTKDNWRIEAQYNSYDENYTTGDITEKCTIEPVNVTLEADGSYEFTIKYTDPVNNKEFKETYKLACSDRTVTKLEASYSGSKSAGTVINASSDITVTATYKDGTQENVIGWTIDKSATLKADETASIKITYENKSCTLKVECSSLSPSKYKAKCQSISYDSLARNPEKYKGKLVKFTGKVMQVQEAESILYYSAYRINVTPTGYGYYDDTVYVIYDNYGSDSRILEDDIVTFYGEFTGLKTYTSVMGASITIPEVQAEYID